jgi:hypothetical protein
MKQTERIRGLNLMNCSYELWLDMESSMKPSAVAHPQVIRKPQRATNAIRNHGAFIFSGTSKVLPFAS